MGNICIKPTHLLQAHGAGRGGEHVPRQFVGHFGGQKEHSLGVCGVIGEV
jgi:hypothetical protein